MDAASTKSKLQERSWRKDQFLISTNPAHFPIPTLIEIFDRKDFYWAKPLPAQDMREMLQNSLSFGLYEQLDHQHPGNSAPEATLIGIARLVTDFITFAYFTDVWVDPSYQGKGLGSWLVTCVQEVVDEMPHLRRSMLFTGDWERIGNHGSQGKRPPKLRVSRHWLQLGLKIALAHLLLNIDLKLAPGTDPKVLAVGFALVPDPTARVMIRRRQEDILVELFKSHLMGKK